MSRKLFGKTEDGRLVFSHTLRNENGVEVSLIDYGAAIQKFLVPDVTGKKTDIVLGYDDLSSYVNNSGYLGAVVGRNANRIANAEVTIEDVTYSLIANNNENNLHSVPYSTGKAVFNVEAETERHICFSIMSKEEKDGFPGNVKIYVEYELRADNTLTLTYRAKSDKTTVINMTNHVYFNLDGHETGTSIFNQYLKLNASKYTPFVDSKAIPSGEILEVAGSPMDFTMGKKIGQDIDDSFSQIVYGSGFDHNYCIDGECGCFREAATAWSDNTGIKLTCMTTEPGLQLYTGNFIHEAKGKNGATYGPRHGFCLETQHYPDAPHHDNFPTTIVKAGETYYSKTSFTARA